MCNRLDTIQYRGVTDGRTDRQTDRRTSCDGIVRMGKTTFKTKMCMVLGKEAFQKFSYPLLISATVAWS